MSLQTNNLDEVIFEGPHRSPSDCKEISMDNDSFHQMCGNSSMANIYNVFIRWSKPRSRHVVHALREWLPMVVQAAKPWMSDVDIEPGSRSLLDISEKLSGARLGISCVTPENMVEPWLQFEAGAL
jgi:hypothetical protein